MSYFLKSLKYHIISLFVFFGFAIIGSSLSGQNYQESIEIADDAYGNRDYYTAGVYYNNALWYDSTDIAIAYKCAESYRLYFNYDKACQWYNYVAKKDIQKKFPQALFSSGMMKKSLMEYDDALLDFKKYYMENSQNVNDYFTKKSRVEIDACQDAQKLITNKQLVLITHLSGQGINTPYSEFNPRQLKDSALVFSALRPVSTSESEQNNPHAFQSKILQAINNNKGWKTTGEIDPRFNDQQNHFANIAFNEDYSKAFFTKVYDESGENMKSEIYEIENVNGKWQKAVKLSASINVAGYTSTQPYFVNNSDYSMLYFVSDRPGGMGNLDIWYSIFKNNTFQEPVNLGSKINTPGDEITPFYRKENHMLYFSSDWYKGLGGFDIFYSQGEFNVWTNPQNIGYPLNSSCNDIYFVINDNDNDGYFVSNRPGSLFLKSETCCNDIYSYEWMDTIRKKTTEIVEIPDTVNIQKTVSSLLPITLYFHNDQPDPRSRNTTTNRNYKTLLEEYVGMKAVYEFEYSKGLDGKKKKEAENDIADFFENYVEKGFSNLNLFANLLLADLSKGNNVKIVIKGFCSPLTTTEYNLKLAQRRIGSITNFLKQVYNGIFIEYLNNTARNGASLIIVEEPLGESTAATFVSDNPNDKRNSVYSRNAAFERKVQIIQYESEKNKIETSKEPQIYFYDSIIDFEVIPFGDAASKVIRFKNIGSDDLLITQIETSCGCTAVDWSKEPIIPNGEGTIKVSLNTHEDYGYKDETITVFSNSAEGRNVLKIKANILPPPK
jgi:hypothetical protein